MGETTEKMDYGEVLMRAISKLGVLGQALSNETVAPSERTLWGMCFIVDDIQNRLTAMKEHMEAAAQKGG